MQGLIKSSPSTSLRVPSLLVATVSASGAGASRRDVQAQERKKEEMYSLAGYRIVVFYQVLVAGQLFSRHLDLIVVGLRVYHGGGASTAMIYGNCKTRRKLHRAVKPGAKE